MYIYNVIHTYIMQGLLFPLIANLDKESGKSSLGMQRKNARKSNDLLMSYKR